MSTRIVNFRETNIVLDKICELVEQGGGRESPRIDSLVSTMQVDYDDSVHSSRQFGDVYLFMLDHPPEYGTIEIIVGRGVDVSHVKEKLYGKLFYRNEKIDYSEIVNTILKCQTRD